MAAAGNDSGHEDNFSTSSESGNEEYTDKLTLSFESSEFVESALPDKALAGVSEEQKKLLREYFDQVPPHRYRPYCETGPSNQPCGAALFEKSILEDDRVKTSTPTPRSDEELNDDVRGVQDEAEDEETQESSISPPSPAIELLENASRVNIRCNGCIGRCVPCSSYLPLSGIARLCQVRDSKEYVLYRCLPKETQKEERTRNIINLAEVLGYSLVQINGQRIFGGPPPGWEGPKPPRGSEVFVGHLPVDCYEDELVPLFATIGCLYELRLMMQFSGRTRGYAFVTYETPELARRAVEYLNEAYIRCYENIGVTISSNNSWLYVGHIGDIETEIFIEQICKITDGVQMVNVYHSKRPYPPYSPLLYLGEHRFNFVTRYALVEYESHRDAAMAKRSLGPLAAGLWGPRSTVEWAIDRPKSRNSLVFSGIWVPDQGVIMTKTAECQEARRAGGDNQYWQTSREDWKPSNQPISDSAGMYQPSTIPTDNSSCLLQQSTSFSQSPSSWLQSPTNLFQQSTSSLQQTTTFSESSDSSNHTSTITYSQSTVLESPASDYHSPMSTSQSSMSQSSTPDFSHSTTSILQSPVLNYQPSSNLLQPSVTRSQSPVSFQRTSSLTPSIYKALENIRPANNLVQPTTMYKRINTVDYQQSESTKSYKPPSRTYKSSINSDPFKPSSRASGSDQLRGVNGFQSSRFSGIQPTCGQFYRPPVCTQPSINIYQPIISNYESCQQPSVNNYGIHQTSFTGNSGQLDPSASYDSQQQSLTNNCAYQASTNPNQPTTNNSQYSTIYDTLQQSTTDYQSPKSFRRPFYNLQRKSSSVLKTCNNGSESFARNDSSHNMHVSFEPTTTHQSSNNNTPSFDQPSSIGKCSRESNAFGNNFKTRILTGKARTIKPPYTKTNKIPYIADPLGPLTSSFRPLITDVPFIPANYNAPPTPFKEYNIFGSTPQLYNPKLGEFARENKEFNSSGYNSTNTEDEKVIIDDKKTENVNSSPWSKNCYKKVDENDNKTDEHKKVGRSSCFENIDMSIISEKNCGKEANHDKKPENFAEKLEKCMKNESKRFTTASDNEKVNKKLYKNIHRSLWNSSAVDYEKKSCNSFATQNVDKKSIARSWTRSANISTSSYDKTYAAKIANKVENNDKKVENGTTNYNMKEANDNQKENDKSAHRYPGMICTDPSKNIDDEVNNSPTYSPNTFTNSTSVKTENSEHSGSCQTSNFESVEPIKNTYKSRIYAPLCVKYNENLPVEYCSNYLTGNSGGFITSAMEIDTSIAANYQQYFAPDPDEHVPRIISPPPGFEKLSRTSSLSTVGYPDNTGSVCSDFTDNSSSACTDYRDNGWTGLPAYQKIASEMHTNYRNNTGGNHENPARLPYFQNLSNLSSYQGNNIIHYVDCQNNTSNAHTDHRENGRSGLPFEKNTSNIDTDYRDISGSNFKDYLSNDSIVDSDAFLYGKSNNGNEPFIHASADNSGLHGNSFGFRNYNSNNTPFSNHYNNIYSSIPNVVFDRSANAANSVLANCANAPIGNMFFPSMVSNPILNGNINVDQDNGFSNHTDSLNNTPSIDNTIANNNFYRGADTFSNIDNAVLIGNTSTRDNYFGNPDINSQTPILANIGTGASEILTDNPVLATRCDIGRSIPVDNSNTHRGNIYTVPAGIHPSRIVLPSYTDYQMFGPNSANFLIPINIAERENFNFQNGYYKWVNRFNN